MDDTKLSKSEYYALKLNRLFWYGIVIVLPLELAVFVLLSGFDNVVAAILLYVLMIIGNLAVPVLGIAGIMLAVWARFTSGYRYRMSCHVWAGVVLAAFFLLACRAGQVYQQMHHREHVRAAWGQGIVAVYAITQGF